MQIDLVWQIDLNHFLTSSSHPVNVYVSLNFNNCTNTAYQ